MKEYLPTWIAVILGVSLIFALSTEGSRTERKIIGLTAQCADGAYSTSRHSQGTCSGHGGVKRWINRIPHAKS